MSELLVVDASAVLATLVEQDRRGEAASLRMEGKHVVAPDLIGYEVLNSLRRRRAAGRMSAKEANRTFAVWRAMAVETWSLSTFQDRLWELSGAISAYDAAYVALAERLDAPLLTADARLSRAPGIRAQVVLV